MMEMRINSQHHCSISKPFTIFVGTKLLVCIHNVMDAIHQNETLGTKIIWVGGFDLGEEIFIEPVNYLVHLAEGNVPASMVPRTDIGVSMLKMDAFRLDGQQTISQTH